MKRETRNSANEEQMSHEATPKRIFNATPQANEEATPKRIFNITPQANEAQMSHEATPHLEGGCSLSRCHLKSPRTVQLSQRHEKATFVIKACI